MPPGQVAPSRERDHQVGRRLTTAPDADVGCHMFSCLLELTRGFKQHASFTHAVRLIGACLAREMGGVQACAKPCSGVELRRCHH